jgi:hypothetical protein
MTIKGVLAGKSPFESNGGILASRLMTVETFLFVVDRDNVPLKFCLLCKGFRTAWEMAAFRA